MCNTCTCGCNGTLKKNQYFSAVKDVVVRKGKIGEEMTVVDTYRIFNEKFVDDPDLALLLAFDDENERWNEFVGPSLVMEDVKYDAETNEYVRKTILTRDWHIPTMAIKEKILKGEYEYVLMEEYVQVFESVLVGGKHRIHQAIKTFKEKSGKIYWDDHGDCDCENEE